MDNAEMPGTVPINQKQNVASDRATVSNILTKWKNAGISDSCSPYASLVLLVDKANGDKRLCIDYRKLNSQTFTQPLRMLD